MKGRRFALLALAPLMGLTVGAAAQVTPPAAVDPDESRVVQELEVVARYPGPALWTVRRGSGQVVVLGGLSPLPHLLQWNTHRLERAMEGADVVLLPPTGRLGPLDLVYVLFHAGDLQLPGKATLWDQIGPERSKRFDDFRTQAKTEAKRYARLKPAIAGLLLEADFLKAAGLASAKPGSTVKELAEAHRIRTRPEGGIPVAEVFRAAVKMDADANRACLDASLDQLAYDASRARPMAEAWANGDLRTVKTGLSAEATERCVAGVPGLKAFVDKAARDAVSSIDAALNRGGKSVAVIDLRLLLKADGVLDQLKAKGASIDVPRD